MALPLSSYSVIELSDTFTEGSNTAIESHTPDTDTSAGGWTRIGTPTMTVIAADDELSGESDNDGNRVLAASLDLSGDFLIYGTFFMPTGETGAAFYGPRAFVGGDRQVAMGIDIATSGGSVLLYYNSATDGYVTTAIDTIDDASWLETPRVYAIERRGDTLYGWIDGTELDSLDMSGTTDFAGSPTCNPAITLGRSGGTSGRVVRCDDFVVRSPGTDVAVSLATVAITTYAATITGTAPGTNVAVSLATVEVTTYAATITGTGFATNVSVGVATVAITTYAATITGTTGIDYALKVGATTIRVRPGGHRAVEVPLAEEVAYDINGVARSGITAYRGYRTVVSIETPDLDASEASTLRNAIDGGDPLTWTGYLVGGTLTGVAENIRWIPGDVDRALAFDIRQSS